MSKGCKISYSVVALVDRRCIFAIFSGYIGVPHFLRSSLVNPLRIPRKVPKRERQDSYPGNDVNEDAPIGYVL